MSRAKMFWYANSKDGVRVELSMSGNGGSLALSVDSTREETSLSIPERELFYAFAALFEEARAYLADASPADEDES